MGSVQALAEVIPLQMDYSPPPTQPNLVYSGEIGDIGFTLHLLTGCIYFYFIYSNSEIYVGPLFLFDL